MGGSVFFAMDIDKKEVYETPSTQAVIIQTAALLCTSPQSATIDVTYGEFIL